MDKSDVTGIAGIVIGAGIAVAALTLPWEIPSSLRHILFWAGCLGILGGILWLVDVYLLHQRHRLIRLGVPICGTVLIAVICGASEKHSAIIHGESSRSLENLFDTDFPHAIGSGQVFQATITKRSDPKQYETISIKIRVNTDFDSDVDFVSAYFPPAKTAIGSDSQYNLIRSFRNQVPVLERKIKSEVKVGLSTPGAGYASSTDAKFSGKVIVYTMNGLTPTQIGDLVRWYNDAGMDLEIRGMDYMLLRNMHR